MGYDVDDIIGEYNIELDIDIDFVIEEALKYEKIHEVNVYISNKILKEVLNPNQQFPFEKSNLDYALMVG